MSRIDIRANSLAVNNEPGFTERVLRMNIHPSTKISTDNAPIACSVTNIADVVVIIITSKKAPRDAMRDAMVIKELLPFFDLDLL